MKGPASLILDFRYKN